MITSILKTVAYGISEHSEIKRHLGSNNRKLLRKENIDYIVLTDKAPQIGEYIIGGRVEFNNKPNFSKVDLWHTTRVSEVRLALEANGSKGYYARTLNSIVLVIVNDGNAVYRKDAEEALNHH